MREPMDPKLRKDLCERLSFRAQRLADCADASHPVHAIDTVLAMMARHVVDTAIVLLGETFLQEVLSKTFDRSAELYGICPFCHARPLRTDNTMCQVCWDQAASDDEITDADLAVLALEADEPQGGGEYKPRAT